VCREEFEREAAAPTIYDVASAAGVSIATVSRVLNRVPGVRPVTRRRVLAAVEALQFVPSGPARSLSRRVTKIVGLLFFKSARHGYMAEPLEEEEAESVLYTDAIIRGAEHAAQERGYALLLAGAGGRDATRTVHRIAAQVDGLVILERVLPEAQVGVLAERFPVVLLAGSGALGHVPTVRVDNETSMRQLVGHLVEVHGHRSLAFVGEVAESPDVVARAAVVVDEAARLGVACERGPDLGGDLTARGGYRAMRRRLESGRPLPEALVCASDQTALGVLRALREKELRVPCDVAVTGFDDISVVRHIRPPLTTVHQPIFDLGEVCVATLLRRLGDPDAPSPAPLPTTVVLRRSCGCGRGADASAVDVSAVDGAGQLIDRARTGERSRSVDREAARVGAARGASGEGDGRERSGPENVDAEDAEILGWAVPNRRRVCDRLEEEEELTSTGESGSAEATVGDVEVVGVGGES